MHLAIVHYHLNRGGVTRVVENQLRGLATADKSIRPDQVTLFHGGRALGWHESIIRELPFPVSQVTVAELDYDDLHDSDDRIPNSEAAADTVLADALRKAGCSPENSVVHIHNHSLGKNARLLEMLWQIAGDGWRLLLQLHDFAEDLRPQNYRHLLDQLGSVRRLQSRLYPQASHVHYAVLSCRDREILLRAGIDASRLHLLPNPVLAATSVSDRGVAREKLRAAHGIPAGRPYVIYPVRAIRRKNIGELLLWAAVVNDATFAVTLAPLNPTEQPVYEHWVALAADLELPVLFDVGSGNMTLAETYVAADATITTSVAEGFGLVFLEASLADRPLFGRDLPGVTADFRDVGLDFPGLADSLQVPADWLDREALTHTMVRLARDLRQSYDLAQVSDEDLQRQLNSVLSGETVDFARLDVDTQRSILRQVAGNDDSASRLVALNKCFRQLQRLLAGSDHELWKRNLEENRTAIENNYSLCVVGDHYAKICARVLQSRPSDLSDNANIGQSVLQQFVRPDWMYPIRLS